MVKILDKFGKLWYNNYSEREVIQMYQEIVKLYQWCKENLIECTLEPLWDGYQIRFFDGSDVVQHSGSYGSSYGCVEPAGMPRAYTAVSIPIIKEILSKRFLK